MDWEDADNWRSEDGNKVKSCPGENDTAFFSAAHFYTPDASSGKVLNLIPHIDKEFKVQKITIEDGVEVGLNFYDNGNGSPSLTVGTGDLKIASLSSNSSSCALALSSGSLTVTGETNLAGGTVTTSGGQTYSGPVTLTGDTTLEATDSKAIVLLDANVSGSANLSVTTYDTQIREPVSLGGLEINGRFSVLNNCSVITTGNQTYNGEVLCNIDVTFTGSTVTFNSTLDSHYNDEQSVTVAGNAVFNGKVGGQRTLKSLSVSGTSTVGKDVTTSGNQTYGGDVTIGSWINFTSSAGSIYFGTSSSPASVNATTDYSGVIASVTGSASEGVYFYGGFTGSSLAGLTVYGNAEIYGTNDFSNTNIIIQYNAFRFAPVVKFESGKWQTIKSISTSTQEDYPITLTSTGNEKWYAYFSTKPGESSFTYTIIENSRSVSAAGSTAINNLRLAPSSAAITDASIDKPTTEGWFVFPNVYYWLGGSDTSWSTVTNWSQDGESALSSSDSVPDSTGGISKITVMKDADNVLALSQAISIKSLTVNKDAKVDFGTSSVTAETVTNNGTVRIGGEQSVTAEMLNGEGSTVEYYGTGLTSLAWDGDSSAAGKQYENLLITGALNVSEAVSVAGTASLNTSGDVALSGDNTFTGGVTIASAGEVALNSSSAFTVADGASCSSLSVADAAVVTLAGTVTTTGAQSYSADVRVNGNLQGSSLAFDGAVTLGASVAVSTGGRAVFSSTVDAASSGISALAIAGPASSAAFNEAVGGTYPLSALTAEGGASFGEDVRVSGALSVDGDAEFGADVSAGSISIGGSASFTAASAQSVATGGTQSYTGAVTVSSDTTVASGGSALFSGATDIASGKTLTVNSSAGTSSFAGKVAGSLVLCSPAVFSADNSFTNLTVESSTNADSLSGLSVTFAGGTTQTVTGTLTCTGTQDDCITLTSDSDASKWTYTGTASAANFSYTRIAYSSSSSVLNIAPLSSSVTDLGLVQSSSSMTTENWFVTAYYWLGGSDSSWTTAENWFYDEAGTKAASSYPPYSDGVSEVVIVHGSSTQASPFILDLGEDITIGSLTVNRDATVDFDSHTVTASAITNNGTVRIGGRGVSQRVSGSITNGTDSTVEYYNAALSLPAWGTEYYNILITGTASSLPALKVAGKTTIDTSGNVSFTNLNIFTGGVKIVSGGAIELNAGGAFTIDSGASCASLSVICTATVTIAGSVATSGSQSYIAPVLVSADATVRAGGGAAFSSTVNIANGATLSVDSLAQSSTFSGAVSGALVLRSPAVFSADNSFTDLAVESSTNAASLAGNGLAVTFAGGTTQAVSGTLSCAGTPADYITLTSLSSSSKWIYSGAAEPSDFAYTYIAYSQSVNELGLASTKAKASDPGLTQTAPAFTTENWFISKYYWLGSASKEWSEPLNWSKDGTASGLLSADDDFPDYEKSIAEIVVAAGTEADSSPYILSLSSGVKLKTLTVNEGVAADFGTSDVEAAAITNNGTVRIGGDQSVSGSITNGAYSTVEYYGASHSSFAWGTEYQNLSFAQGAGAGAEASPVSSQLNTSGKTLFANGEGNGIYISGACGFGGAVVLGSDALQAGNISLAGANTFGGGVEIVSAGDVALNSSGAFTIAGGASCSSLAVAGTGTVSLAGAVTTSGAQSYSADVELRGNLSAASLVFNSTVRVSSAAALSTTGGAAAFFGSVAIADGAELSLSTGAQSLTFSGAVSGALVLRSPAVFSADNSFTDLTIESSTNAALLSGGGLSVTFAGGTTQAVSGTLSCAGTQADYITLASSGAEKWIFSGKAQAANFAFTYIANSTSENALYIASSPSTVMDWGLAQEASSLTTANWFITAYYWFGSADTSWTTADNWRYDEAGAVTASAYPPYTSVTSDIVIAGGSSQEQSPFILRLDGDIGTKSLVVNAGAAVDFGTSSVAAAAITNNGTVRIGGEQAVSGLITNGADSTVEYYGKNLSSLVWGTDYSNIAFAEGASAALQAALSVSGTAVFENGEGNAIALAGDNVFSGRVVLGGSAAAGNISLAGENTFGGGVEIVSAGDVALNSSGAFTIADGASCSSLSVAGTDTVSLTGAVTTAGAQSYSAGVELNGNLAAASVVFNSTVRVSSAAALSTTGGDVSFLGTAALGADLSVSAAGKVSFARAVDSLSGGSAFSLSAEGSTVEISADIGSQNPLGSVTAAGNVLFNSSAGKQSVITAGAQSYNGAAVLGADTTLSAGGDLSFGSSVDSLSGESAFALSASALSGAVYVSGAAGASAPLSSLSLSGREVLLNGIGSSLSAGVAGKTSISAAESISLYIADYATQGEQVYSAAGGVRVLASSASSGTWKSTEGAITLSETDLFLDCPSCAFNAASRLSARNVYLYNGILSLSGNASIFSAGDFAVWGASYSADDPRYSGADTRFAFYEEPGKSLSYQASSGFGAEISALSASVSAGGNFYANGADLSGFELLIPDNSSSGPVFNPSSVSAKGQWGIPYAAAFNSTITNVSVASLSSSGVSYLAAGAGAAQNCVDGGGNSNVQFNVPGIARAYTVYDDVLYVEFDMALENSNGEIDSNISFLSDSLANGGVWISSGAVKIEGAYSDSECTLPLSSEDVSSFYLKSSGTWNTDATGSSSGGAQSTDRSGAHRTLVVDLSFIEGVFTAAQGHTMCRSYGAGLEEGESAASFSSVEDQARPVLAGVYTGQELHSAGKAGLQSEYDAHNFIEFRYSEAVDIGSLASGAGDINIRATASLGAVSGGGTEGGDGLVFAGLASLSSGVLDAFSKTDSSSPHSLYRKFSVKAGEEAQTQSHRIRVSIAGYVDGTVSFSDPRNPGLDGDYHNWIGCIRSASTPSGTALPVENSLIKDSSGNAVDASGSESHPLPSLSVQTGSDEDGDGVEDSGLVYGEWDVLPPVVAPFVENYGEWSSWANSGEYDYAEIIGTAYSASDTSLRNLEIHLLDNNRTQAQKWGAWWKTKAGWNNLLSSDTPAEDESLPEARGGARPFIDSAGKQTSASLTSGGIRLCSLRGEISSFSYKTVIENVSSSEKSFDPGSDIYQVVYGGIYRKKTNPLTQSDGLYLRLPLPESSIPVRTSFVLSFNPAGSYITDLAGNLLSSSYSSKTDFASIEITPPAVSMTLSPVGENKVYAVFTKELAYNAIPFGRMDFASLASVLDEIKESFVIVPSGSGSSVTGSSIAITGCEYVSSSSDYTALLFTLERNVTLSDVESLWIRNIGHYSGGAVETVTDIAGFAVPDTKISDYLGNYMEQYSGHTLSDFALNVVEPVYAYSDSSFGGGWSEDEIYGIQSASSSSTSVRDFSGGQGNSSRLTGGSDIIVQVNITGGKDSAGQDIAVDNRVFDLIPSAKSALSEDMVSDRINALLGRDWRVWLPTSLESLASRANSNALAPVLSAENADSGKGFLWNYTLADSVYGFASGEEVQFVFRETDLDGNTIMIDHDADGWGGAESATDKVPLYALCMPSSRIQAGDFSFVDLWSFGLKSIQKQRGGVTILNNVIDVNTREQTLIEVDMPEAGSLNVYVMTLDGNIVKRLAHGHAAAGTHYYRWNGTNSSGKSVARGLYFVRVSGPGIDETRKVLCVKN